MAAAPFRRRAPPPFRRPDMMAAHAPQSTILTTCSAFRPRARHGVAARRARPTVTFYRKSRPVAARRKKPARSSRPPPPKRADIRYRIFTTRRYANSARPPVTSLRAYGKNARSRNAADAAAQLRPLSARRRASLTSPRMPMAATFAADRGWGRRWLV